MFDISFGELALIVAVAVVFIGPEDLPVVLRALAKGYAALRKVMHDIHAAFEDVAQDSGLRDVQRDFKRQTTWIDGDDGDKYEAYDISDLLPPDDPALKPPPAALPPSEPEAKP